MWPFGLTPVHQNENCWVTWEEVAQWCCDHDQGRLKAHERAFVADMASRLVLDGEPTEKQAAWLRSLYARLHRGGA